jgi:hypothetical protein
MTGGADPEDEKLVTSTDKPRWDRKHLRKAASTELVDTAAASTEKVMMMFFSSYLISWCLSRDLDQFQPSILNQAMDISIDSC